MPAAAADTTCSRCGHRLDRVMRPLSRLRWTRYWWEGFKSFFTGPLWICSRCGAIYTNEGNLLAAGAVATDAERRLEVYRRDMATLRDAFGGVIIAAELVAIWLVAGPQELVLAKFVVALVVGIVAIAPFTFFARKAHVAKRELKRLRAARRGGSIPAPAGD